MLHYIYLIRWIILTMASGCLIYNSRFFKEISGGNRFVIGVASTPQFIALYDYVLGLIWSGAPVFLFRYGIIVISVAYLIFHKNYQILSGLFADVIKKVKNYKPGVMRFDIIIFLCAGIFAVCTVFAYFIRSIAPAWVTALPIFSRSFDIGFAAVLATAFLFYHLGAKYWTGTFKGTYRAVLIISSVILFMCLSFSALSGIFSKMPGWDESHYDMQARFFVEDRNSWEIDYYTGDKEGAILPDDHGPLWEMIIADADFFAYDTLNSGMVRLCHSIIGFLFYIAIFNYGYIISGATCGALSVVLTLFYRYAMSNTFYGSREGFRFLALYFFVAYMFNYIKAIFQGDSRLAVKESLNARVIDSFDWLVGAFVISYLGMNGHGSNVVIMFSIFLIYTIVAVWKKTGFAEYILTGVATLAGVLLCLEKNIRRYLVQGRFTSSTTWAFRGTEAADMTKQASEKRGDWGTILSSYTREELLLIAFGIISIAIVAVYCIVMIRKKADDEGYHKNILINTAISFGMLLPLMGVYDALGYKFSVWMVEQIRYRMYFLIVFAIMGASLITVLWKSGNKLMQGISFILCVLSCMISAKTTILYTSLPSIFGGSSRVTATEYHIETSDDIIANYHTTGNIFVSDQILGYFFRIPTKLGFTDYNHAILAAADTDEIEAAIDELNLETFVFSYQDSYYHYDVLPFYDYLKTSDNVTRKTYTLDGDYEIDVYFVDSDIWD